MEHAERDPDGSGRGCFHSKPLWHPLSPQHPWAGPAARPGAGPAEGRVGPSRVGPSRVGPTAWAVYMRDH